MALKSNTNKNTKKRSLFKGYTLKDVVNSVIVPIIVVLITVFVTGAFQIKAINKSSEAQLEAAIKTAQAQIKAAEITKVEEIEYDFKETNNWNVDESSDYMPLAKGNYWIYTGTYNLFSLKLDDYISKDIKIKFEVVEELESYGNRLYIVNNFPLEMKYEFQKIIDNFNVNELVSSQPIEILDDEFVSGLLLVANKLFFIPTEELDKVKKFIEKPDKFVNRHLENLPPILSYDNLIFEFPMFKGQRFGDLNNITSFDKTHFWYVNDMRTINSLNGGTFEEVQTFDLIYDTLPDQQKLIFRPYLGILSYSYIHKGTNDDFEISLSEFSTKNK